MDQKLAGISRKDRCGKECGSVPTDKKHGGKRIMAWVCGILILLAAAVGGYALYGSVQMKKLPALHSADAIKYTLKDSKDGVITVGVYRNGETSYTVYGENGAVLPQALHTYEIGSLTKTVTAALVQKAVQEGRMSLDAPIDTYLDLPKKAHYPTVEALLTHTSGYRSFYFEPPMRANFFKGRNDFYGIGDSMILSRLAKTDISDAPHGFVYSNFGYAALGLILEKVYQTEFTTLMNGFLHDELGLMHTHLSDGSGDLGKYWDWMPGDTYMAAGALTSNVEDMLAYARLSLADAVCGGARTAPLVLIDATKKQYAMLGIRMDQIGFGWIIDAETGFVWHNGATGSYNCYMGLDAETETAVVVLSNLAPGRRIPATVIGVKLLSQMRSN